MRLYSISISGPRSSDIAKWLSLRQFNIWRLELVIAKEIVYWLPFTFAWLVMLFHFRNILLSYSPFINKGFSSVDYQYQPETDTNTFQNLTITIIAGPDRSNTACRTEHPLCSLLCPKMHSTMTPDTSAWNRLTLTRGGLPSNSIDTPLPARIAIRRWVNLGDAMNGIKKTTKKNGGWINETCKT